MAVQVFSGGSTKSEELDDGTQTLKREKEGAETHSGVLLSVHLSSIGKHLAIKYLHLAPNVSVVISIYVMHTYRSFLLDSTAPF
jgi:hypothetical protein